MFFCTLKNLEKNVSVFNIDNKKWFLSTKYLKPLKDPKPLNICLTFIAVDTNC